MTTHNSFTSLSDTIDVDDWKHIIIPILGMPPYAVVSGTWPGSPNYTTNAFLNGYVTNTTATNGDLCEYQTPIAPGTYSMSVMYLKLSAGSIFNVDISLDGGTTWTTLAAVDSYAAATGPGVTTVTGIKISKKTVALLRFHVIGKNAGNVTTSYYCCPSYLAFSRTA